MLVRKFGGTSMGSVESLTNVVEIVKSEKGKQVLVVSAMSGVTNELLKAAKESLSGNDSEVKKILADMLVKHTRAVESMVRDPKIQADIVAYLDETLKSLGNFLNALGFIGELSIRSHNLVMAVGERLSAYMLAGILSDRGVPSEQLDLEKVIPDGQFATADAAFYTFTEKTFAELAEKILAKKKVPVATGYFGFVPGGMLDAIGRGYSDFSAALMASGLKAENLEIWTDVSGILTADPRKAPKAKIIDVISSEAAAELAHFGAKVLHPQSVHPAMRAKIPVWIKNTFEPKARGTEIIGEVKNPSSVFTSVTSKKGVTVVNVASYRMLLQHGFLAHVFNTFAKYEVPIDVVSTSEVSISVTIEDTKHLEEITAELRPISKITVSPKKAIVCLVGMGMKEKKGVASEVFSTIAEAGISADMISQGASEINITFVIDESEADKAVAALHKKFFE